MKFATGIREPDYAGFAWVACKHGPDRARPDHLADSTTVVVFEMKDATETQAVAGGYAAWIPQKAMSGGDKSPMFFVGHEDAA